MRLILGYWGGGSWPQVCSLHGQQWYYCPFICCWILPSHFRWLLTHWGHATSGGLRLAARFPATLEVAWGLSVIRKQNWRALWLLGFNPMTSQGTLKSTLSEQGGASQSGPVVTLWWNTDSCLLWIRLRKCWWRLCNTEVMADDGPGRSLLGFQRKDRTWSLWRKKPRRKEKPSMVARCMPWCRSFFSSFSSKTTWYLTMSSSWTTHRRESQPTGPPVPGHSLGIIPAACHHTCSGSWIRMAETCDSQSGFFMFPSSPRRQRQPGNAGPSGTLLQHQSHQTNGPHPPQVWVTASLGPSMFLGFSCPDLFPFFSQPLGL